MYVRTYVRMYVCMYARARVCVCYVCMYTRMYNSCCCCCCCCCCCYCCCCIQLTISSLVFGDLKAGKENGWMASGSSASGRLSRMRSSSLSASWLPEKIKNYKLHIRFRKTPTMGCMSRLHRTPCSLLLSCGCYFSDKDPLKTSDVQNLDSLDGTTSPL